MTTQNLKVVRTDADKGLIMVKGSVPGSKGGWVTIKDATKKPIIEGAPFPGSLRSVEQDKVQNDTSKAAKSDISSGSDEE